MEVDVKNLGEKKLEALIEEATVGAAPVPWTLCDFEPCLASLFS